MTKETKNVITKETIAKDIQAEDKKSSRILLIIALVYVVVVSSVFWAIYFWGLKSSEVGVIGYVIFFAGVFICLFPLFSIIVALITGGKGPKDANFYVITDAVLYKEEKTIRRRNSLLVKKVIHLCKCGEVEVNSTCYQITAENDVFYVVVSRREPKRTLKCYPAKLYEYVE